MQLSSPSFLLPPPLHASGLPPAGPSSISLNSLIASCCCIFIQMLLLLSPPYFLSLDLRHPSRPNSSIGSFGLCPRPQITSVGSGALFSSLPKPSHFPSEPSTHRITTVRRMPCHTRVCVYVGGTNPLKPPSSICFIPCTEHSSGKE